jgi:transcription antitermination factor NusG
MSTLSSGLPVNTGAKNSQDVMFQDHAVSGTTTTGWWAVYTKHQHEKKVAELLALKGADVFLPVYESVHRWKDRTAKVHLPLFPSYLFVREDTERPLGILSIPGVFMIVGTSAQYAKISDTEIAALRKAAESPRGIQPHPYLTAGCRVRIKSGPLGGVQGVLVRRKNTCRVVVSVELLAQSASVEVNEWEIGPDSSSTVQRVPEWTT